MTKQPASAPSPSALRLPPSALAANRGFTLAELVVSLTILALIAAVASGLTLAALQARDQAGGANDCTAQARAVQDRLRWAVGRAATMTTPDGPRPALVAVEPSGRSADSGGTAFAGHASRLVVWCGGRGAAANGGQRYDGVQDRLPRAEELLIFAHDPGRPWRLTELWPAGNAAEIDLFAADLPARLDALLAGGNLHPLTLSDRLRVRGGTGGPGCVRFEVSATPTAAALAAATAAADPVAARAALPWAGGASADFAAAAAIGSPAWGLRTVRVRACVQLTPLAASTSGPDGVRPVAPAGAVPFFAAAARTYRHEVE